MTAREDAVGHLRVQLEPVEVRPVRACGVLLGFGVYRGTAQVVVVGREPDAASEVAGLREARGYAEELLAIADALWGDDGADGWDRRDRADEAVAVGLRAGDAYARGTISRGDWRDLARAAAAIGAAVEEWGE